jgi:hypothetical protein
LATRVPLPLLTTSSCLLCNGRLLLRRLHEQWGHQAVKVHRLLQHACDIPKLQGSQLLHVASLRVTKVEHVEVTSCSLLLCSPAQYKGLQWLFNSSYTPCSTS